MDTNAWNILAQLLDMACNEFSNHGCNDFELPNTPENRVLMVEAEIWNAPLDFRDSDLTISQDGTKIYANDSFLMAYFAHLAHELAGG